MKSLTNCLLYLGLAFGVSLIPKKDMCKNLFRKPNFTAILISAVLGAVLSQIQTVWLLKKIKEELVELKETVRKAG